MIRVLQRINPGMMTAAVSVARRSDVKNEYGEQLDDWTMLQTVRAAVAHVPGQENNEHGKVSIQKYEVYVRAKGLDIKLSDKLLYEEPGSAALHDLDIITIVNYEGRSEFLYIECEEKVRND